MNSSPRVVNEMISAGQIGPLDVVLDLGCGDGAILLNIALAVGCKCIGYDIDGILCATGDL